MTPLSVDVVQEPEGRLLRDMLGLLARHASSVVLVVRDEPGLSTAAKDLLTMLEPHRVETRRSSSWPGTSLIGDEATVLHFAMNDEVLRELRDAASRLYQWQQPELPEDLAFLRADGTAVLLTICHERDASLVLSEGEYQQILDTLPELATVVRVRRPESSESALIDPIERTMWRFLALRILGEASGSSLVEWAGDALAGGWDTPALRILAGLATPANEFEVDDYVRQVLRERELEPIGRPRLMQRYARIVAEDIVSDAVDPEVGLHAFLTLGREFNYEGPWIEPLRLDDGLASARARVFGEVDDVKREIVAFARSVLDDGA